MPKHDLIIDSNERGSLCESIERKAKKAGLSVARKTLVVGDYLLGAACVEAKSTYFSQVTVGTFGVNSTTWMPTTSASSCLSTGA